MRLRFTVSLQFERQLPPAISSKVTFRLACDEYDHFALHLGALRHVAFPCSTDPRDSSGGILHFGTCCRHEIASLRMFLAAFKIHAVSMLLPDSA